jgi:hypothetical protein
VKKELPHLIVLLLLILLVGIGSGASNGVQWLPLVSGGAYPAPQPTATPPVPGHDTTVWHEPALGHHHGADPMSAAPEIVALREKNPVFAQLGGPWQTSALENEYPYPGKHVGFINLVESDIGCADTVPGYICVDDYYMQVHSIGNYHAWATRFHSFKLIVNTCQQSGMDCRIATGGWHDFAVFHDDYKQHLCDIPGAANQGGNLHQPPYVVAGDAIRAKDNIFWSSLINPVTYGYYSPVPNWMAQTAWIELDVWSSPKKGETSCADESQAIINEGNRTKFQVFTIRMPNLENVPRPFSGFTDRWGHIVLGCTQAGLDCVPLYVGPDVPAGNVYFNRSVIAGDPAAAPIQTFPCPDCVMPAHP